MLHLITEDNKELNNRCFPIPKGIRKHLERILDKYSNYSDNVKDYDGWKRLNNILNMDTVSYVEMKRIKNFFDSYNGTKNNITYVLNGGDEMKLWVNNTLNTATKSIHDFKQSKKDSGIENSFIKSHEKERQIRKDRPTQTKFQTKNINKNISNDNAIKYESIIKESSDALDSYQEEYGVYYVLNSFLEDGKGSRQNWNPLIPAPQYKKALEEFTRFGTFNNFPTDKIYQWMGIIMKNTCILQANTELAGHCSGYPLDDIYDFIDNYMDGKYYDTPSENGREFIITEISEEETQKIIGRFLNSYELSQDDKISDSIVKFNEKFDGRMSIIIKKDKLYYKRELDEFLNETGLYDYMIAPDGNDAISDYGLEPLWKIINKYDESMSPEEVIVLINKALDVYHCRGDLASLFITGGSSSLSKITNGGVVEKRQRKNVILSEQQVKQLKAIKL